MCVCLHVLTVGWDIKHTENHSSKGSRVMWDILKSVRMAFHCVFHLPIDRPLPFCLSASQTLHPLPRKLVLLQIPEQNILKLNLHESLDFHQSRTVVGSNDLLFVWLESVLKLTKDK